MTTIDTSSRTYTGVGRFLDRNGMLIDVGRASLTVIDEGAATWGGTLAVYKGSSLVNKKIEGLLELADGTRALVIAGPKQADLANDLVAIPVHSAGGPIPF